MFLKKVKSCHQMPEKLKTLKLMTLDQELDNTLVVLNGPKLVTTKSEEPPTNTNLLNVKMIVQKTKLLSSTHLFKLELLEEKQLFHQVGELWPLLKEKSSKI